MKANLYLFLLSCIVVISLSCGKKENKGELGSKTNGELNQLTAQIKSLSKLPCEEPSDDIRERLFIVLSDDIFNNYPTYRDSIRSAQSEFERRDILENLPHYREALDKEREDMKKMIFQGEQIHLLSSPYDFKYSKYVVQTNFERLRYHEYPLLQNWLKKNLKVSFRDTSGINNKEWGRLSECESQAVWLALKDFPGSGISRQGVSVLMPEEEARNLDLHKKSYEMSKQGVIIRGVTFRYYWRPVRADISGIIGSMGHMDCHFFVVGEILAYQIFIEEKPITDLVGCGILKGQKLRGKQFTIPAQQTSE
jgi:hypothetical protein